MPAKSRKQQKFLYARFGKAWVKKHHFNKIAKRKQSKRKRSRVKR